MRNLRRVPLLVYIFLAFIVIGFNNCHGPLVQPGETLLPQKSLGTDTGNPMNSGIAQMPKVFLNSYFPTLSKDRKILAVGSGKTYQNCQEAIEAARPGDEVVIDAGYVCSPIRLKDKGSSEDFIIIRSSRLNEIAAEGQRLSRAEALKLAIIETSVDDFAVIAEENAHHYHLAGLEVRLNAKFSSLHRGLISIGPWYLTAKENLPRSIVIARSWIHAGPRQEISAGIRLNGSAISIVDSIIEDIHAHTESAPAILGWKMGPGPFKIVNNELLAAGGGLSLGGYVSAPEQIPSDVEFKNNHVHQKIEWRQSITSLTGASGPWRTGSLLSFSNAQRILVNGNLFENQWAQGSGHYGYAIEFTPDALSNGTAGSGQAWVRVQDITFTNNIVRNAAGAFNIIYQNFEEPRAITQRLEISNNLVYAIGNSWGASLGVILLRQDAQGPVVFNHNTILNTPNAGPQLLNPWSRGSYAQFTFTNNLCSDFGDGIKDSNHATGSATLRAMFPGLTFNSNVLVGQSKADYMEHESASLYFPEKLEDVGFLGDPLQPGIDYKMLELAPTSPFAKKTSDGQNMGANFQFLPAP